MDSRWAVEELVINGMRTLKAGLSSGADQGRGSPAPLVSKGLLSRKVVMTESDSGMIPKFGIVAFSAATAVTALMVPPGMAGNIPIYNAPIPRFNTPPPIQIQPTSPPPIPTVFLPEVVVIGAQAAPPPAAWPQQAGPGRYKPFNESMQTRRAPGTLSRYQQTLATPFEATPYAKELETIMSGKCPLVVARIGDHRHSSGIYIACMQANGFRMVERP
jgi:hypothetical protein